MAQIGFIRSVTHYAGAITVPLARGRVAIIDSGGSACCSGERARQIRAEMRNTYEPRNVTCKACLKCMAKAEARLAAGAVKP